MSLDASVLQIRVESTGIADATKALNDLAVAGEAAEKGTSNIGSSAQASARVQVDAAQQAVTGFNNLANSVKNATAAQDEAAKMAAKIQEQLEKIDMLNQIQRWKDAAQAARDEASALRQAQVAANGMNKDVDAFVATLKRQADTVGMNTQQLRDYNAEQLRQKAAQLGVSQQVDGYINSLKNAKGPHESFNLLTAGSARELMVLGHELSQGNFQRFGGSLIVLGERINFLPSLLEKAGAAAGAMGASLGVLVAGVAAVVAVTAAAIITWNKSATALHEMKDAVVLTGGAAGATGDQLYAMANRIGDSFGEFGKAREAVLALANTGKFTADQIGMIAEAAVGMEKYAGVAIDKTVSAFEKLAGNPLKITDKGFKDVSNAAMQLDEQLHFLEPTVLAHIIQLERQGDHASASKVAIAALAEEEKKRTEELKANLTTLGAVMESLSETASKMWNNVFHKESMDDQLKSAQDHLQHLRDLGHGDSYFGVKEDLDKIKALQNQIAQNSYDAAEAAHKKTMDRLANEQQVYLRNLMERAKGEENLQQRLLRFDTIIAEQREKAKNDPAFAAQTREVLSDASVEMMRKQVERDSVKAGPKPKSDGLSGLNEHLAELNAKFEADKRYYDNQVKFIDDLQQKHLVADSAADYAKKAMLENEFNLEKESLENQIALVNNFHSTDTKLMEQAGTKKFELQKKLDKLLEDNLAKRDKLATDPAAREQKEQEKADQASQHAIAQTVAQTMAIEAKIKAYNSLPEAVKASGITEKQMQDAITQSTIDWYDEKIKAVSELGPASEKEVQRLKAEKAALEEKTKAQKDWEEIQAKNNAALNRSAALTKIATEQVKIWKDTGNEIEKALKNAFGNSGEAAGKMFKAFADNQAQQIDLVNQLRLVKDNDKLTEEERIKQTTALQDQSAQATIGSYGSMADAAAGFFDKQSSGYKAATAISKVFHAAETAMALASIPAKLAAGAATMFAQSGWGAFAGIAAMTAAVAAFGVAVTGGGGGPMSSADQQKVQGTGTVLGSQTIVNGNKVELVGAKSDSIANSLKIMEKDAGLGLSVQNAMLDAMQQLNNSITSFATLVVQQGNLTGVTAPNTKSFDSKAISGLGAVAGGVGGAALGTYIGMGIGAIGGPLGMALGAALGTLIGHTFLGKALSSVFGGNVTTNDTGFTMGKSSLGQIDQSGVNANQYTNTTTSGGWFRSDSHNTQLTSLGADFNNQLTMVVKGMQSTLQTAATQLGLSGDDFDKKLQSFVVDIGNVSLKGMTGDQIQQTLQNVFSKLGDQMAKFAFSDLQKYQKIGEGMLETVSRVASDLATMQKVFLTLGKTIQPVISQSEALVTAFGSVDNLTKGVKGYVNAIYTDQQKLDPVIKDVSNVMASLGYSTVTTKDQFKALVDGLDLTTQHGQDLFKSLMAIAPEFGQVADAADQAKQKAIDDAKTALNDAYKNESQALQSVIDNVGKFTKTLKDLRDNTMLGSLSPLTPMEKYAEAKAQFDQIAKAAQGGDADAQGKFESAYNAFLQASQLVNASGDQYKKDFTYAQAQAELTQQIAQHQVDVAQASLDALNKQVDGLITINASVMSVTDAINKLIAAQGGDPGNQILNNERNAIESLYGSILHRHSDDAGMQFWLDSLSKGVSISQIANDMYNSNEYKGIAPATTSPTQSIAPVTAIQTGTMSGQSADVVAAIAATNEKLDALQTTIATTSQQQVGAMYDSQSTAADTIVEGTSNALKSGSAKLYALQER